MEGLSICLSITKNVLACCQSKNLIFIQRRTCKRVNDCFFVLLLIVPSSLADPVGVFDYTEDIGNYHGGGTVLELHEVLMDGARILLNDVANGGSAVFATAP